MCGCTPQEEVKEAKEAKPVIYLYPEEETEVTVKLDYTGELTVTYPEYKDGWTVTAMPDGSLYDADGIEYSYLFWEGESDIEYDLSKGFCVAGEDTADFLREKLSYMGLTPREYNEFIVYWLPYLQENEYNLITFQGAAYTEAAGLEITPEPDNILRVFMVYEPLDEHVNIEPQELPVLTREGFTVVEWGGRRLK
ncbi:MAG: hypothetical protein IKU27_06775 [Clostridia bacterium]|nr:hypothetical protein [Clostridia bacterium]